MSKRQEEQEGYNENMGNKGSGPFDPPENDILMDATAAGRFLGGEETPISPETLCCWRLKGRGPSFLKVGRLIRYRRSDLRAYLHAHVRRVDE